MTYGTTAAPESNPHANAALAADCEVCNGWGSVITSQGRHELCQACQSPTERECPDSS
ncbi:MULTISPECIES: hypothetical protein [unclassified Streptomyces]|uniref:hypothetical protein n=1 Tax=unclassified Streptomyces TaxID=2593676 RepID=UPI0011ABDC46|nr:hypothetical protein [Streptomyces sp. BK340]TVZ82850.1 hypothetical protein FB157_124159 [Streptomyces sp. BK340]